MGHIAIDPLDVSIEYQIPFIQGVYYIYEVGDPRYIVNGEFLVKYVGKGKDGRMYEHYKDVLKGNVPNGNNWGMYHWLKELIDLGLKPTYKKVYKGIFTNEEAYQVERHVILKRGLNTLLNMHANDCKYPVNLQLTNVSAPATQQVWGVVYSSKKYSKKGISHAKESYDSSTIGIKGTTKQFMSCGNNIQKVKKDDIIFLYDNVPESGVHGICVVEDFFKHNMRDSFWTNELDLETFTTRVNVKFIAFDQKRIFHIKNRPEDWWPKLSIVNLTSKTKLVNDVFKHFNIDKTTLDPSTLVQKINKLVQIVEEPVIIGLISLQNLINKDNDGR